MFCIETLSFKWKHNDWLWISCTMTAGIRHGYPLSAFLFLFVAEILAIKIKDLQNINGIKMNNHEIKNIQHADDLTVALNDEISLLWCEINFSTYFFFTFNVANILVSNFYPFNLYAYESIGTNSNMKSGCNGNNVGLFLWRDEVPITYLLDLFI